jgi:hypothetical protein
LRLPSRVLDELAPELPGTTLARSTLGARAEIGIAGTGNISGWEVAMAAELGFGTD